MGVEGSGEQGTEGDRRLERGEVGGEGEKTFRERGGGSLRGERRRGEEESLELKDGGGRRREEEYLGKKEEDMEGDPEGKGGVEEENIWQEMIGGEMRGEEEKDGRRRGEGWWSQ